MVGQITDIVPLPSQESGKVLNYVTVDVGKKTYKTVCGAPNVKTGMKSAFAGPGTSIAEGHVVNEQMVAGHLSQGMLCSPKELGWGD